MKRIELYEGGRVYYHENGTSTLGVAGQLGELLNTIEGDADVATYFWVENYQKLSDSDKRLIDVFYPSVETRVTERTKAPDKLLANARAWCLDKESLRVNCPRCGGTGNYSYNALDGTRCYGCNGKKYTLPRINKKYLELVASARAAELSAKQE